jgi:cyclophilin family peptidyl-prolyl cis-trans isomerase
MSNKTLMIILGVIVVVIAGTAVYLLNRAPQENQVSDSSSSTPPGDVAMNPQATDAQTPSSTSPTEKPPVASPTPASVGCTRNFDANKLKTAKVNIENRQAQIDVKGFGKITVEFYNKDAPKTVENFLRLANAGYYDCLTFHRVSKGFVIQGGDPTGTGGGGDSAFGGPFADELNPDTASYKAGYLHGVLAMANAGPNTNTSQFFIMLGDLPLDHKYTIFGKVISGLDVVDKIGQVDIVPNPQMGPTDGAPVTPVVMQSVKIIK